MHGGRRVELLDIAIRQDWDSYLWAGNLTLASLADYQAIKTGDALTLVLQGSPYALTARGKSHQNSGDGPSVTVRVASPTVILEDAPLITKTWSSAMAREACEELSGAPIDWRIVNWRIPAGRLTCEGATRIAVIRRIAKAAGAIAQTAPDGTLRVQYRFPVSVPGWDIAPPNQIYTDRRDNLSYSESYQNRDRWNAVVISDESDVERTYALEYIESDARSGTLRVYAEPWLDPGAFRVSHTGDPSILIGAGAVMPRIETETIEFKAGAGALRYPVHNLISVNWRRRDLAPVVWEWGKKELKAAGGGGYSIAVVTYETRAIEYPVNHSVRGELTQFLILIEEN